MRFLHLADVHLDTPFAGRTEQLRSRLRQASRTALRNAVDCAISEELDAVLVAGDLFDGRRLSFETERFLMEELHRLGEPGIEVVYATGNHDPGRGGLRAHRLDWPAHVTVVGERSPRRIPIRREGREVGWVTAAGHESERETRDLSRAFPPPAGNLPEVGLLHTQVTRARDAERHDPYAPSELAVLRRSGHHYWALGHVHVRQRLSEAPPVHYPGNIQGRTPAESGAKGGLLVDLSEPGVPAVEFRPFGPVRWETLEVDGLEEAHSVERLTARIAGAWRSERETDRWPGPFDWIVRVVLKGPSPLWAELSRHEDRQSLADRLAGELHALDVTVEAPTVHPVVSVEDHRRREDVLGEALKLVRELRRGGALDRVADIELARFATSPDEERDRYVRSLLEDAEGEILARLLADPGGRS